MGFSASEASIPNVNFFGRFVAPWNLGEFAHVAHCSPACFLSVDPMEAGRLSFLYFLDLVHLVNSAKGAVSLEFRWHFHYNYPVFISNTITIC
jgi:hypothetical protein